MLAMEQFERLILAHNVEFRGGFYMQSTGINGETRELYVQDTREVFCNTCRALATLIEYSMIKGTKEKYAAYLEELDEITKEFIEKSSVSESIVLGETFYEKEEDKILLEEYNNKKLMIWQKVFELISREYHLHRFWSGSTTDD